MHSFLLVCCLMAAVAVAHPQPQPHPKLLAQPLKASSNRDNTHDNVAAAGVALPAEWQQRSDAGLLLIGGPFATNAHVGNGQFSGEIFTGFEHVAGVFNGAGDKSHRAGVPSSLFRLSISGTGVVPLASGLDLERSAHLHLFAVGMNGMCQQTVFPNRDAPHLMTAIVECNNTGSSAFSVTVTGAATDSLDLKITPLPSPPAGAHCWNASIIATEDNPGTLIQLAMCESDVRDGVAVNVPAGQSATAKFVSVRFSNVDSDYSPANSLIDTAVSAWKQANSADPSTLWSTHLTAMLTLWSSHIEVEGNINVSRAVNASMAALLATVREGVYFSSSPGGLGFNSYNGHTFWDVETWMWPNWLILQPAIARDVLQYRLNRVKPAAANSVAHGFQGLMFPWESAFSGIEVDPAPETTTEEHLQGDIAFAFVQYWQATQNKTWLTEAYPVIEGIATFWASKAILNADGSYSIPHIMGPDEYHGDVTDSVYCNIVAKISMMAAFNLAPIVGVPQNQTFTTISSKLVILFNETAQMHPEFHGYTGDTVKQADTIMLGYPLNVDMPAQVRANDLDYYANRTDKGGPAMTWSMFSINYKDIGQLDKAAAYFQQGYVNNLQPPFLMWSEVTGSKGAENFITGAGGFLQSVWAGYAGLRIMNDSLFIVKPLPLPGTTSLTIKRFSFLSNIINLQINQANATVALDASSPTSAPGLAVIVSAGSGQRLTTTPILIPLSSTVQIVEK